MVEYVYVVIDPELGWDNVVGVYKENVKNKESLELAFPAECGYVIKRFLLEEGA